MKLLTNVSSNVQLFIYFRLCKRKFKEVLNKITLSVKKIRKLQMKGIFYHMAGRNNREIKHIQQH